MKKCPYCAEEIQDEAIVCRYCGRDLVKQPEPTAQTQIKDAEAQPEKSNIGCVLFAVVLVVAALIWVVVQSGSKTSQSSSSSTPEEKAWYACTAFIEKQLGLSILDAQDYNPNGVASLSNSLYRVTVYYATNSSTYQCEVLKGDGTWELKSLKLKQ